MINIGFVILTWNSGLYIKKCIDSIVSLDFDNIYICIVDNGSSDNTIESIKSIKINSKKIYLDLIRLEKNKGTTISRNIGIKKIKNNVDYICVLDSDTIVNQLAIEKMIDLLNSNQQIGIVGPILRSLDGSIQPSGRNLPTLTGKILKVLPFSRTIKIAEKMDEIKIEYTAFKNVFKVGYLMSACWMMKKTLIEDIGLLDENIFYAPEDVEFCLRAWSNGYSVLYDKNVEIIHEWQRISRRKLISKHNWEHIKGLLYLFFKYKYLFRTNKFNKFILNNK